MYAPLAHRLGIHKLKWELEDLAFQALHPRKYAEIKAMVAERRADREEHVDEAAACSRRSWTRSASRPRSRAARSTPTRSTTRWPRRAASSTRSTTSRPCASSSSAPGDEGTRDCYGALGLIHSLWKPMPGRFKDYVAMPKFNGYRALHTTVIGPAGRAARDPDPDARDARRGGVRDRGALALQARPKQQPADEEWLAWVKQLMDVEPGRGRSARVHEDASEPTSSTTRSTSSRRRAR